MGCGSSAPAGSDIKFENGKPTFKGDEVVRSFDKGNGLLFRIVNKKTKQWALYNDTKDLQMVVEVMFSAKSKIKALGKTLLEEKPSGEFVASVIVAPLATEMFIEGTVDTFTCKFDTIPVESTGAAAEHHEHAAAPAHEVAASDAAAEHDEVAPPAGDEDEIAPAHDDVGPADDYAGYGNEEAAAAPAGGEEEAVAPAGGEEEAVAPAGGEEEAVAPAGGEEAIAAAEEAAPAE